MWKYVLWIVWVVLMLAAQPFAWAGTIGATSVNPSTTTPGVPLSVTVTSLISDPMVIPASVTLERLSGGSIAVIGTLHDDGLNGDALAGDGIYSLITTILESAPTAARLRVSASFTGTTAKAYSAQVTVNVTGTSTSIKLVSPANNAYVNTTPATVSGTVGDRAALVNINGINAPVSNGNFVATVPLNEGPNTLTAVATNANGTTSTASTVVTLDTTPPHVAIYTPSNNTSTTDSLVTVTGMVNDIVVGTVNPQQATVKVNGVAAQVLNRTFTAANIPLSFGANTLQAVAVDRTGNSATTTATVTRQALTRPTLRLSAGNGQTGPIRSLLPVPLIAQLLNGAGVPVSNAPIVFRVTSQDGTLSTSGVTGSGVSSIVVNTDANGKAAVRFTLGSRAGAGNNIVEASATGVATTAVFTASATTLSAGLVTVDSGNNQFGVVGQPLPLPFIAIVTDAGYNRLAGVPVTFTVKKGGGNFGVVGKNTLVATSDSDGRVTATLTLGPDQGVSNNLVEASFPGNTGFPVAFTASGQTPGPANQTKITGVVLDNSNIPLPGVTIRLFQIHQGNTGNVPQQVATPVQTDAQGQFTMQPVPVGVFKLMADGGTAQRPGSWPTIEYDMITVPGQNNTVGSPIFLPELKTSGQLCVGPLTGGTLTVPEAPGFALDIAPGSVTFPGGSRTGCVSVTTVNMDKVPMVPGFGQQPRFIVTIQPVGAKFDPPAAITIPNVDGLAPKAVTEMYSYDHDLASFVAIGTGTVSDDGSVIKSDLGVGVLKAGWHCGGNPNTAGSAGTCPTCKKCQGNDCVVSDNDSRIDTLNKKGDCQKASCRNGSILNENDDSDAPQDDKCKICKKGKLVPAFDDNWGVTGTVVLTSNPGISIITDKINAGLNALGVKANISSTTGEYTTREKDCCDSKAGVKKKGIKESEGKGTISVAMKGLTLWGPPTITKEMDFGIAEISIDIEVGVKIDNDASLAVNAGKREDQCKGQDCWFSGINSALTITPKATLEAILCEETLWTSKHCGGISFTPLAVAVSFEAGVNYNKNTCSDGITGNVTLGKVVASSTFNLGVPGSVGYKFEYEIYGGATF